LARAESVLMPPFCPARALACVTSSAMLVPPGSYSFSRNEPEPRRSRGVDQRGGGIEPLAALDLDRVPALLTGADRVQELTRPHGRGLLARRPAGHGRPDRLVVAERAGDRGEDLAPQRVGVARVHVCAAAGARDAAQLPAHALVDLQADDGDVQVHAGAGHVTRGVAGIRGRAVVAAVGHEDHRALSRGGQVVRGGPQRAADRRAPAALQRLDARAEPVAVERADRDDQLRVAAARAATALGDARAVHAHADLSVRRQQADEVGDRRLGRVESRAAVARVLVHGLRRVEQQQDAAVVGSLGAGGRPADQQQRAGGQQRQGPGTRLARPGAEEEERCRER
jgi:hypothetical protein